MNAVVTKMDGLVGYLWLDNPKRHNALNQAAWQAIPAALNDLQSRAARVVIIAGRGDSFCAGADIAEFDTVRKDAASAAFYEQTNADAFAAIGAAPMPVISAIDGYCLGGGFGIAAACDIRIATHRANFGVPAARLGLAYPVAAMADIVSAIGEQNTKRLLFTAGRFNAEQMNQMGFLMDIVEAESLMSHCQSLAHDIASLAPMTHSATKAAIRAIHTGDSAEAEKLGSDTFISRDYAAGRAAFRQKIKPEFSGQ